MLIVGTVVYAYGIRLYVRVMVVTSIDENKNKTPYGGVLHIYDNL
jgi:hypothetical protein